MPIAHSRRVGLVARMAALGWTACAAVEAMSDEALEGHPPASCEMQLARHLAVRHMLSRQRIKRRRMRRGRFSP